VNCTLSTKRGILPWMQMPDDGSVRARIVFANWSEFGSLHSMAAPMNTDMVVIPSART